MELLSPRVQEPGRAMGEGDFPERAWLLFKGETDSEESSFLTSKPCGCRIPYQEDLGVLLQTPATPACGQMAVGTLVSRHRSPSRRYSWCVSPFGGRMRVEMIRS